jgi:hypothetical protein
MEEVQPDGSSNESKKVVLTTSSILSDSFEDVEQTERESPKTGELWCFKRLLLTSQTKKRQVHQSSTQ